MIPRLEAEESNLAAERIAIGTGAAPSPRAVIRRWREQANPARKAAAAATARPPALFSPEVLARLQVRRVVKRKG